MRTVGPFVRSDVAEAGTALPPVGSSVVEVILPYAGTVHGISVDLTGALSAGSAYLVTACVNGAPMALGVWLGERTCSGSCFHGGVAVTAGDCLTVRDTAEGGAMGIGAAVVVWVDEGIGGAGGEAEGRGVLLPPPLSIHSTG